MLLPLRTTPSVAEQEGQLIETEATGAPQKHHHTLNQSVGSITAIAGVIYLFLLSLVAIVVASLVPVYAIIIVFSTAGAMFLISMLAGLLFNVDPGSHRFIIMMTLTGLALVIIVNAALMSERPIWVISCLMIVLWSGIISHGRNKLLELAGKCHSEELWSPVRCAFTGALTLYYYFIGFFGILAAIAITLVWQRHTRFFH